MCSSGSHNKKWRGFPFSRTAFRRDPPAGGPPADCAACRGLAPPLLLPRSARKGWLSALAALALAACVEVEEEEKGRPLEPPQLRIHNSSQFPLRDLRVHPEPDYRRSRNVLGGDMAVDGRVTLTWDKTQYVTVMREKVRNGKVLAFTTATPIGGLKPGYISELHVFDESFRLASVFVPPPMPAALAAGPYHVCALDRTSNVKCWGAGYAWRPRPDRPRDPFSPRYAGYAGATALAAGEGFTCALKSDRSVRCWGTSTQTSKKGKTTTWTDWNKVVSDLPEAVGLAAGGGQACALGSDGTVWCWVSNFARSSEEETTAAQPFTPVAVTGLSDAEAISVGTAHACALRGGGRVACWGFNGYGQLGDGTKEDRAAPVDVPDLTGAIGVSAGGFHTCSVLSGGSVRCWGDYERGQLGNGTGAPPQACLGKAPCGATPVDVSAVSGAVSIAAGSDYTCALLSDGTLSCWGWNGFGQLGNGRTAETEGIVQVSGLQNVVAVSAGVAHTCARVEIGTVYCWGYDHFGQLAKMVDKKCGREPCSSVPVEIPGLP